MKCFEEITEAKAALQNGAAAMVGEGSQDEELLRMANLCHSVLNWVIEGQRTQSALFEAILRDFRGALARTQKARRRTG